ncbi:SpoIIE family protein phosphatase [Vibrio sp. CAU 1672]|uniref:ATP-binding SpoIIE family protein phosphatase n=1 Tax=Vibrio sp. CAU 1672 TaxID=3032594 RepID=UPI0023DC4738|nr:SpoIIE family protein phosphatase [Vibrio sp. CAU 1672]MDF2153375.1 SpoIIE family protein phosphatase [Vibrio sp. CAU 1672]
MKNTILLVDDSQTVLLYLCSALEKQGYEVVCAENGEVALDIMTVRRDIQFVLSDLMMPGISGIELCKQLKSGDFQRYVFFVLLSSRNDQISVIEGIDSGADDFIDKKTPVEELQARIRAGFRTLALHNSLTDVNHQLNHAYQTIRQDLAAAGDLISQLLPTDSRLNDVHFSYVHRPCAHIGGDMLGYMALDAEHVAMYVLDVAGHGIASALLSFSIQQTLSQREAAEALTMEPEPDGLKFKISRPEKVVERLNRRYQQTPHNQLYFTIAYAVLNTRTGEFRYCTAGHPRILWQKNNQTQIDQVGHDNFAVGVFEGAVYAGGSVRLSRGDQVWLYTDGLTEAKRSKELYSQQRLSNAISSAGSVVFEQQTQYVIDQILEWQGGGCVDDDMCLLLAQWDDNRHPITAQTPLTAFERRYISSFSASRSAGREIADYLRLCGVSEEMCQQFELCVVELMNNAFLHAYKEQEGQWVTLRCETENTAQRIIVRTEVAHYGEPMAKEEFLAAIQSAIVAPNVENLNSFTVSGRGLMIVANLMDQFLLSNSIKKSTYQLTKEGRRGTEQ